MDPVDFSQTLQLLVQSRKPTRPSRSRPSPALLQSRTESERRAYVDARRLAYVSEAPVWWCEQLGTVLANEEVVDGKTEVGGFPVVRKPMRQWMLRITAYAERLLGDLGTIEWSHSLKEMQRNWIGRSDGAEVDLPSPASGENPGLHHPARYSLWRHLHGPRAGAQIGG